MEPNQQIQLKWLNGKPQTSLGVTWGVPWQQGVLDRSETLALVSETGRNLPVQTWPLAYWPDGSVKWTAQAASFGPDISETYRITKASACAAIPGASLGPGTNPGLRMNETDDAVEVDTGKLICRFNKNGSEIIRELMIDGERVCSGMKLVGFLEETRMDGDVKVSREEPFEGYITMLTVEQNGPVRGVIKVEGRHRTVVTGREWLPFTIRCYFYANLPSIGLTHTFVYDGEVGKDGLKGLGLSFEIPLCGALYNRHVKLTGDTGLFCEAAQFISRQYAEYNTLYPRQVAGEAIGPEMDGNGREIDMVQDMAIWDSFKIIQDSADHYVIRKRTKPECCWVDAVHGRRSGGAAFVGGTGGGFAAGLRDFWQKYPSALEVDGLSKPQASLKLWLWPPEAGSMDLRHYDTGTHTVSSYEGSEELRSTPYGIANTNEIDLYCFGTTPSNEEAMKLVDKLTSPPLLVCHPQYYHAAKVFGVWSLPDRSNAVRAWLEDKLETVAGFYQNEIEQRRWYGLWNYGDLMHTYDPVRHSWRYDMGGYAWQNTELAVNMWLWYSFLRTGAPELFKMAAAMTRHTSEVDLYHIGEYAGLGSRHNVVHWGCGCKEPRIGMAGLHRFYYYLTCDERIGDIMDEVKDADDTTVKLDPMRAYFSIEPQDPFPTHARSGPDWAAFCSNWLTRWERYEDGFYRDKLLRGIECLKKMPFRLCSGPTFGYDPRTGNLYYIGDDNYSYHMVIAFGAAEIWIELAQLLEDEEFQEMLAEFGEFYHLSNAEKSKRTGGKITGQDWSWPMFSGSIAAFAANLKSDPQLALKAWRIMLDEQTVSFGRKGPLAISRVETPGTFAPLSEIPWITTNEASMWSLRMIESLELIGDYLAEAFQESNIIISKDGISK